MQISSRSFGHPTLATDLDGTFAHGPASVRARVVAALARAGDGALVYVTGRSVAAWRALMASHGLPAPAVAITDVGTDVVDGRSGTPLPLAARLSHHWPGAPNVRARLRGLSGLDDQGVEARYRVSYTFAADADRDATVADAVERLRDLPVDLLVSADRYLDILPRGVNKGTTLLRLLAYLGRDAGATVVAGDTMNDLSLFATGLKGVLVRNAEPPLKVRLTGRLTVHYALADGIEGVAEGLAQFGLAPPTHG